MTDVELLLATEAITGVGGWACDAGGQRFVATPQARRLLGLPAAGDDGGDTLLANISVGDRARWHALIDAAAQGPLPAPLVFVVHPVGGPSRRLRCDAVAVPGGGARGSVRALDAASIPAPMALGPLASEFAVEAAGIGIFEIDLQAGTAAWSDRTLQIYGLPPGSPAPSRVEWRERFLHPDDWERADRRRADFVQRDRPYELDYRIWRADDGAPRWLHSRASFARGDRRYVLGITLDITERKLAEERASEARLALEVAAEQVGFGFGFRDIDSGEGEWSPQLKRMFGIAADAPTPPRADAHMLVDEADRERVAAALRSPMAPGELREFEFFVRDLDGNRRLLMTRMLAPSAGRGRANRQHFAVIDLTATRTQDRRVAGLLERLQLCTEATGIGIGDRDRVTGLAQWDDTMLQLFGLPPGTAAPTTDEYLQLIHPDDRDRIALELQEKHLDGKAYEVEYRVVLPDGAVRWLLNRGRVHLDGAGRIVSRSGISFDITERRDAEAARQARAVAESANAAKTEFLSRMSHELRTPLNAVLGFAQLILLDASHPLGDVQRARVEHVQSAGWHLLALMNDVLDLTGIESRRAVLRPEAVALGEVIEECLTMTANAAAQRGVTVRVVRAARSPETLWADRTRLKQVLLNLLSNAIKYNHDHGWVEVEAIEQQHAVGCDVSVLVRDSAGGMAPEQLGHLFEPFNRLGRERGSVEGTGIGLALSRMLAEQMDGRLEAHSQLGVGSEFCLTLPAAPPAG